MSSIIPHSNDAWTSIQQGGSRHRLDKLFELGMAAIASSATIFIFLIFLFVVKEALPVFLGQVDTSKGGEILSPDQLERMNPGDVKEYLELTNEQYHRLDQDALRLMMEVKFQAAQDMATDPQAGLNTASWDHMIFPYQWTGYEQPEYIWQPVSSVPKFNLIPLLIGSLKTTLVALLFATPLALGAAVFVSQLCPSRFREWIKPAIELLAGIPSVVLGFFALMVLAGFLDRVFGVQTQLNATVAGIALGLAVIPIIFSISEDALSSVPRHYSESALALGSSPWFAAWKVVIPAAFPGIVAAIVLGFGRAIGETMIVLMASGNASIVSWNLGDSARTMTATIAAEMAETVFGDPHYRILFMLGVMLFVITFCSNWIAGVVIQRLKLKMETAG